MTRRLYYDDATCLTFEAEVIGWQDGDPCRVVLDQSAFYPTSGGQPHDLGVLDDVPVVEVTDADDVVIHHLTTPLPLGRRVVGVVEPFRRRDHMQQHTAQHLLSALLADRLDRPTVSVHFGARSSSIEVAGGVLSEGHLADLERWATEAVAAALPVSVGFEELTEAMHRGLRSPPSRAGTLRVVTIAGLDRSACGGTHVDRTSALGMIHLTGTERLRGHSRLSFLAGDRTVQRLRELAAGEAAVAQALGCAPAESAALLPRRLAELAAMRDEVERLREERLHHRVEQVVAAVPPGEDGVRRPVIRIAEHGDLATMALIASGMVRVVLQVVADHAGGTAIAIGASPDSGTDAGAMLRALLVDHAGRGGGSPRVAQGVLSGQVDPGGVSPGGAAIL